VRIGFFLLWNEKNRFQKVKKAGSISEDPQVAAKL
jgi:hypothetical protein